MRSATELSFMTDFIHPLTTLLSNTELLTEFHVL